MKKISNNTFLGKLTQILNLAVLVFFIISMVFLLKFDKLNVVTVEKEPGYLQAKEKMHEVTHPMKKNQAEVDYYAYKLDTLQQRAANADKKTLASLKEDIDRTKETLSEKEKVLAQTKADSVAQQEILTPIEDEYNNCLAQSEKAEGTFNLIFNVTLFLFAAKLVVWAIWTFKNSKNLRGICSWMDKAAAPAWAFFGWIVPVYNLIKPYSFFSEIYEETEYALKDKSIITNADKDNDFLLGIWWGLFLVAVCVMTALLFATFFGTGACFYNLGHSSVAIASIVMWALYILIELCIIQKYNKMNKLLVENESKF